MRSTFTRCAAVLSFLILPLVAQAEDYTWTNNGDGTCTITDYTGPGGIVIIPDTLGGLTVTVIGNRAFFECTGLTGVIIPDSVTTINDEAFACCENLTFATIGKSVITIGYSGFHGCASLTSVTIPNSVTTIGVWAFAFCNSLTHVTIPDSVTTIGSRAFYHCISLTDIKIPDSVATIGSEAFYYCTGLTSAIIGNGVTTIGSIAFAYSPNLVGVYFRGDAPGGVDIFYNVNANAIVYYIPWTSGWGPTYGGLPTVVWPPSPADANGNYEVDIYDFAALAGQWLQTGCDEYNDWCQGADFNHSGTVDVADLLLLADDWLWP
ncbi:MAG: leucine-rich repeat domain-containing protein [Sedimentisphaerales bacterium]|nr:leucine-rich repeat domain-containing protein [Sedimentisphaerales bacterium]